MGTTLENPNVIASLDSATDTAFLRLDVDIVIPRERYLELATLMDAEQFDEAFDLMLNLRPDAADYLGFFFGKKLCRQPLPTAARVA